MSRTRSISQRSVVRVAAAALFAALAAGLPALEVSGRLESIAAPLTDGSADFISARGNAVLELRGGDDESGLYLSASLPYEFIASQSRGIELGEAFFTWASESADLRVGRQLVTWGRGDGVYISDRFCPFDYREMSAVEYDDVRVPVEAVRLRYLRESWTLELVWVPVSAYSLLPDAENPWAAGVDYSGCAAAQPGLSLENGAGGLRWSAYWGGLDTSLFCSTVIQDTPEFRYGAGGVEYSYPRLYLAGGDLSASIGSFTLRGEGAFVRGGSYSTLTYAALREKDAAQILAGLDWKSGTWSVSVQLSDSLLFDYSDELAASRNTATATADVSKNFLSDTLTLGASAACVSGERDWTGGASFALRPKIRYAFTDSISLSAGALLFLGDADTEYGRYKDNSHLWFKAVYRF